MRLPSARLAALVAVVALVAASGTTLGMLESGGNPPKHVAAPRPMPTPPPSTPTPTPTPTLPRLAADTVSIPSQHVVAPVGVCDIVDGGLEPPANVHHTCRWAGGAELAAMTGTTVITGHINWVGQGTGALGRLSELRPGATIYTSGAHADVTAWRVVRVVHREKSTGVDTAAFVGRDGPRQLYLVSCGGAFDASVASYEDNIYVLATPVT